MRVIAGPLFGAAWLLCGTSAWAQTGDRTGPLATPPILPDMRASPSMGVPAAVPVDSRAPSGVVTLEAVNVVTGLPPAPPLRATTAIARTAIDDRDSDLVVTLTKGQAMDAAWIVAQFRANGMPGSDVPLDRIVALVQRLNLAFIRAGYINSGVVIVPQRLDGGGPRILRLQLVTGRLAPATPSITWQGGERHGLDDRYIVNRMPSARVVPLDAVAVERDFRLLADDPSIRTIAADLIPGAAPGEASLALTITPAPQLDAVLSYANNRAPSVGGERAGIDMSMRNLIGPGDVATLSAGLTGDRPDVAGSWTAPILAPRTGIVLRGAWNRAAVVDAPLVPLNIRSRDWLVEGGVTHDLLHRPLTPAAGDIREVTSRNVAVGLLYTRRVSRTYLLGEPFSFSPGSVRGRAAYGAMRATLDWSERSSNSVWVFALTATMGLNGTRSDVVGVVDPDRHFKTVLAQLSHARRLTAGGLELRARLVGQVSAGALYSGERFAIGGENSVRGYRETLLLTDMGAFGSVELAQPFSLTGRRKGAFGFDWGAFTASTFADAAYGRNLEGQTQPAPRMVYSVGASLAWTPTPAIMARLTYGQALKDANVVGSRDLQDRGVQFRVTLRPFDLFR